MIVGTRWIGGIAYAQIAVCGAQDVLSVAGTVHPTVYDRLRRRVPGSNVLTDPAPWIPGVFYAISGRSSVQAGVTEIIVLGHIV